MAEMDELVEGARAATGDLEIDVAGVFMPRGFVGSSFFGAAAGGAAGALAGGPLLMGVGAALGSASGGAVAGELGGDEAARAWRFVVAASPTTVHVLHVGGGLVDIDPEQMTLVRQFDRGTVRIEVHGHVSFRRLVLEDPETHDRIELDGQRGHWRHASAVIAALLLDEDHAHPALEDDEPASEA